MNLRPFYQQQTPDEREVFAARIGTTPLYYRNVAYGFRRANAKLALAIERESAGLVPVHVTRPDLAKAFESSGYRKTSRRRAG